MKLSINKANMREDTEGVAGYPSLTFNVSEFFSVRKTKGGSLSIGEVELILLL